MPAVKEPQETIKSSSKTTCYHCGVDCITNSIAIDNKVFCCEGCKLVYEILNDNGLCDYYKLQSHPGLSQIKAIRNDKYAYLDSEEIASKVYTFTDGNHTSVTLYIPGVHCSSCMWLLEHLHKLNDGITDSRLNFTSKEVTVRFLRDKISLRKIVELLATVGYEPYISLEDTSGKKATSASRKRVYKLGVAGFCFGNIMLMSFPEYLSGNLEVEHQYAQLFRLLNLLLSLPVFFYSASEFYASAWAGLKQRVLNIDAPIVLALVITFSRSVYEIVSNTGSGYLDSMAGIVFFMLVGRIVQERTYKSISFDRDYKSYFPIAVNVVTATGTISKSLQDLKEKDVVELYNEEIVPADAIVVDGTAKIDYSFVSGESLPVTIEKGKIVYAGGRQLGDKLIVQIVKPVAGSYLTSLWSHYSFSKNKTETNSRDSIIHTLSRYFTVVLFVLAAITALYWFWADPSKILPSVSAMLIVACPCALLLSASYTNGNLLRLLSNNGLFLRDVTVIEQIGKSNHLVFDKTGTLTQSSSTLKSYGHQLSGIEKIWVYNIVASSSHPYSKLLKNEIGTMPKIHLDNWKEYPGKGVEGQIGDNVIKVGSASFTGVVSIEGKASFFVRINDRVTSYAVTPVLRKGVPQAMQELVRNYRMSLLSGDNDKHKGLLKPLFDDTSTMLFEQKPIDKLNYIERLQEQGQKVIMIGDGLNDAGALQQSNVGITLADDVNNFTPSCDAILDASKIEKLPALLKLSCKGKQIINVSFIISILYNIVGLWISVQGMMSPMIAAILMPISTLSIVLISTGLSSLLAKRIGLSLRVGSI